MSAPILRLHMAHPAQTFSRAHLLATVFEAQNGACLICGARMEPLRTRRDQRNPMRPTLDHVRPLAFGGVDGRGNVAAVHFRCNNRKGAGWPTEGEQHRLAALNAKLGWSA